MDEDFNRMNIYQTLLEKIHHNQSPYTDFPVGFWAGTWYDDHGARREMFTKAIDRVNPGLIVEVGSFVGESAIFMSEHLKKRKQDAAILCIDTWMGGIDHWEKRPADLKFWFGRPSLYYQFMGNVIQRGHQDMILPLSLDSLNGARLLRLLGIVPSLVYVDASHEQGDALRDYEAYWNLLDKGGGLLVDDLTGWFPGVLHDWAAFTDIYKLNPEVEGEKGFVIKP